jgi:glycosyltransferase involved in cell wall biosynthesis
VDVFQPRHRRVAREVFGIPHDHAVVLCAAAWLSDQRKGLNYLLEAMKGLRIDAPITLVSVGAQPEAVKTEENHIALGSISSERLLSFAYSVADIFVMPTLAEAFGLVALEAMACGVPVVASDVGGIPDFVRPQQTGLLVKPGDAGGLRQAIALLLGDPGLRERLSRAGRAVAVEEFSLATQAGRYIQLYSELIENRLGSRASIERR